ncbi:MAG: TlpA disulfide reductase family protein [Kofleriaceae bacterium]
MKWWLLVVLVACDDGKADKPLPSRAEGAKVAQGQKATTEAFCDVHKTDDSGPMLEVPPVGEVKVSAKPGEWTWLNIWATWCKPCVEEMPRIARWREKLSAGGAKLGLQFVSLDDTDDAVAQFDKAHADAPRSARLADPKAQQAWFKALGLDENPTIPIHVFVSPTGHVRCVRAGSINEKDYASVEMLLKE